MSSSTTHTRPLFGARPESYFGDRRQFCELIINKLKCAGEDIDDGKDPEVTLGRYHQEDIVRKAFDVNLSLDDLLPIPISLSDDEANVLMCQAERDGVQAFAVEGELPPPMTIAKVLLQFMALDNVCAPLEEWTPQKREFMDKSKAQFDQLLSR